MSRNNPRRKRGYPGVMPSDTQLRQTVSGDGEHRIPNPETLTQPSPAKIQKATHHSKASDILDRPSTLSALDGEIKFHRFFVLIAESEYLNCAGTLYDPSVSGYRTRDPDNTSGCFDHSKSQCNIPAPLFKHPKKEFRFYCKLKDAWCDKYTRFGPKRRRRQRKISTGDSGTDKILSNLELQGYFMQELLSRGRFSSVVASYSQIHRKNVALKFTRNPTRRVDERAVDVISHKSTSWDTEGEYSAEMYVYDKLRHERIAEMFEYYVMNGQVCMVLEFCENGNLKQLLEQTPGRIITETIARNYFYDMLAALEYIHNSCFVHRDIDCEHFLVDQFNRLKLCDFSLAESYKPGDSYFKDRCGAVSHLAPEVLVRNPSYDPRPVDLWALGVTLYHMTVGHHPFVIPDLEMEDLLCETFDCLVDMQSHGFLEKAKHSARLSCELLELFRGIFNHAPSIRFTLNRIKFCDWNRKPRPTKPQIGNFFMVQQPQKKNGSRREKQLKLHLGI